MKEMKLRSKTNRAFSLMNERIRDESLRALVLVYSSLKEKLLSLVLQLIQSRDKYPWMKMKNLTSMAVEILNAVCLSMRKICQSSVITSFPQASEQNLNEACKILNRVQLLFDRLVGEFSIIDDDIDDPDLQSIKENAILCRGLFFDYAWLLARQDRKLFKKFFMK